MKSIKDVASEIGITKATVYNFINRNNIETIKKAGIQYIDEETERLIAEHYSKPESDNINDKAADQVSELKDNMITTLQKHIDTLTQQLEEKDKTIQSLTESVQTLSESNKTQSQLLIADKITTAKDILIEGAVDDESQDYENINKGTFFRKIFKKK